MIEVIYKEEKAGEEDALGFHLPRNIRQIGLIHENYRIYMEDYVYSFLGKAAALTMRMERLGRTAVLLGEVRWQNGVTYVFVRGAVLIEKTEVAADHIVLREDVWKQIGEECSTYFPHQEVVGWFLAQPEIPMCATEILTRAHVKYFGGEKILFLMEPTEREDAFFRFENNFLQRQSGYYLYYEKNEAMQNYMLTQQEMLEANVIEKTEDEAVKNFRKIIQEKNASKEENKGGSNSFLSLAATACLVLAVGMAGMRFYQKYQETQKYRLLQEADLANSFEVKPVITKAETIDSKTEKKGEVPSKLKNEDALQASSNVRRKELLTVTPIPSLKLEKNETQNTENSNIGIKNIEIGNLKTGNAKTEIGVSENVKAEDMENAESTEKKGTSNTETLSTKTLNTERAEIENPSMETSEIEEADNMQKQSKEQSQSGDQGAASETINQNTAFSYVVRPGDSLFQISLDHYGTIEKISEICQLNGFSEEEVIYPGQIIVLP